MRLSSSVQGVLYLMGGLHLHWRARWERDGAQRGPWRPVSQIALPSPRNTWYYVTFKVRDGASRWPKQPSKRASMCVLAVVIYRHVSKRPVAMAFQPEFASISTDSVFRKPAQFGKFDVLPAPSIRWWALRSPLEIWLGVSEPAVGPPLVGRLSRANSERPMVASQHCRLQSPRALPLAPSLRLFPGTLTHHTSFACKLQPSLFDSASSLHFPHTPGFLFLIPSF